MPPFKSKNKKSAVVSVTSTRKPPAPEKTHPENSVSPSSLLEPKEQRLVTFTLITKQLGEVNMKPQQHIKKIIRVLGSGQALLLLTEAMNVEAAGGMMCLDGSRRRTPGGIFFFLAKQKHPDLFPKRSWKETKACF
jgi:hypothetical protein